MKAGSQIAGVGESLPRGESSAGAQDEISRLKHANAVNSEIAASLRAQREHDQRRSIEQAALLCSVTTQLQSEWKALSERGGAAGEGSSVIETSSSLLEDLGDYMSAWSGTLALESEPVHLGTFMRQIVAQACATRGVSAVRVAVSIPQHIPERVRTDVRCLSKVLLQFIGTALDRSAGRALSLQVYREGWDLAPAECVGAGTIIALATIDQAHDQQAIVAPQDAAAALRAALASRLCELMGASLREDLSEAEGTGWYLSLPLEASVDPARANELERANADQRWANERRNEAGAYRDKAAVAQDATHGAIDFLHLDRQLGSLAQLVLSRTAPAFLKLTDDRLTSLVVAHEMADLEQIRDLAQIWKASAMTVGGREFAELLGSIERQAAAGHLPGEGTMRPIWDALKRLDQALRALTAAAGNMP